VSRVNQREIPYYNTLFHTATPAQIELGSVLAELTPDELKQFLYTNSGPEANDTAVRLARMYCSLRGKKSRRTFIGRRSSASAATMKFCCWRER
jgi:adenosylmethionine-8-amino-7-oxononanoate aminotransferase